VALFGEAGQQLRTLAILEASSTETNASVAMGNESAGIAYDLSFGATPAPVGEDGVDWAGIEHDTHGYAARLGLLDSMVLSRFGGDLAEIEADFLNFESLTAESWEADITGLAGVLEWSSLSDEQGRAFQGFDDSESAWILALQCSTCFNPAPPYLAILEP